MEKIMIFAAAVAMLCLASCQREEIGRPGDEGMALVPQESPVFTANIAGQSKTTVDVTDGKVAWEQTDEITVTDAKGHSAVYEIESINPETGRAAFVIKDGETALGDGPYTAVYGTEPAINQTYSKTAGKLYMTAPQTSTNSLTFTVQCGLLKLNLTKEGTWINKVEVTGVPAGSPANTDPVTFTLTCSKYINSPLDFYIALPAGDYTKIVIYNSAGGICTKTVKSAPLSIAENHIKPVTFGSDALNFIKTGPITLKTGPTDVILAAKSISEVSGATIEWTVDDGNQNWEAALTPSTGATLTSDVAGHKFTLTVPPSTPRTKINQWTITVTNTDHSEYTPVVINVLQQCYNSNVEGLDAGFSAFEQKGVAISDGVYHFLNYSNSWMYCHPSFVQGEVLCYYSGKVDARTDYAGTVYCQALDGNNGRIGKICADMLVDIKSDGAGKWTMSPYGCTMSGLGIDDSGNFRNSCEFKDYKWDISYEGYGWIFKGENGRYLRSTNGSQNANPAKVIYTSTDKGNEGSYNGQHIKLFKVQTDFISISPSSIYLKNIGDSFDVTVDCFPEDFTITPNSSDNWVEYTINGNIATFRKVKEPSSQTDYTYTFKSGANTSTLTIMAAELLTPNCTTGTFYPVEWASSLSNQSELTFMTWIKTDKKTGQNQSIMGPEGTFLLRIENDQLEVCGPCFDGYNPKYSVSNDNFYGAWHHVAVTFSDKARTLNLYVDGECVSSSGANHIKGSIHSINLNGTDEGCRDELKKRFYINAAYEYGRYVNGTLAYMRVWKRALSQNEIMDAKGRSTLGGNANLQDGLIADWDFTAGAGNVVTNNASTGNTYDLHAKNWRQGGAQYYIIDGSIEWANYGKPM